MKRIRFEREKTLRTVGLLLLCLGLLAGCTETVVSSALPDNRAKNDVRSESYLVSFSKHETDDLFRTSDDLTFSDFLQKLTMNPPGYVRLQPVGSAIIERDILDLIEQSGLHRVSAVDVFPVSEDTSKTVINVEVTSYFYTLGNCGAELEYRMLDHVAMTSPGFGCAVERNRMLSLANPGDWHGGGHLPPPLARSDIKAVTTYNSLAPVPFPPANK